MRGDSVKARIYRKGRIWFAHTAAGKGLLDIESCVIAVGDTPEQAYTEWERLMKRRRENDRLRLYTWFWLILPQFIAVVLAWIFLW